MITVEALCVQVRVRREDVERWIGETWVRPDGSPDRYLFDEIDVARGRLIMELRDHLRLDEEALPVVLSLLDQLYEERRRLRRIRDVLADHASPATREELLRLLRPQT